MTNEVYLYPYSAAEARRLNEISLWRASYKANIACKQAIEESIQKHFDGMHLSSGCVDEVIAEFGYMRTAWVLANTVQQKDWDGRFKHDNKQWSSHIYIPPDLQHNCYFVVESHPAVLDGFITRYRQMYQDLGLFGPEHCEANSYEAWNYDGQVLVLSPDTLKESCWTPQNQLWLARGGFGCSAHAIGRAVYCTCLGDGEITCWNRTDFVGVLKNRLLPQWAKEKLNELQSHGFGIGGMEMT